MCRYECYYMCTVCLCCWWWWAVCQLYFLQVNTPTSSVCSCLSGQDRVDWRGNRSKCHPYTLCLNVTWFLQRQHSPQGCLWRGSPPFRLPPSSLFLAQRHNCSKVLLQRSNITQEEQQSAGQEGLQQMKMSVCLMGRPQAMHNTGQDKWKFVTGDKSDLIRDSSWTIAEHTNMSKTGSGGDSWCECLYFLVYSLAVLHAVERRYSVYFAKPPAVYSTVSAINSDTASVRTTFGVSVFDILNYAVRMRWGNCISLTVAFSQLSCQLKELSAITVIVFYIFRAKCS